MTYELLADFVVSHPCLGYGAVLSIVEKTTTGPAVEMSWVVRYLTNKIDTITAVCYLALSSGFPGAMRQPIVCESRIVSHVLEPYLIHASRW